MSRKIEIPEYLLQLYADAKGNTPQPKYQIGCLVENLNYEDKKQVGIIVGLHLWHFRYDPKGTPPEWRYEVALDWPERVYWHENEMEEIMDLQLKKLELLKEDLLCTKSSERH